MHRRRLLLLGLVLVVVGVSGWIVRRQYLLQGQVEACGDPVNGDLDLDGL